MDLVAIIRIALRTLARNKLRTGLTMLGIIIGVAAVIAMVGIGQGAQRAVQDRIASMGSNRLWVMAGSASVSGFRMGFSSVKTLTVADMEAIRRECTAVSLAAPSVRTRAQVVYQNQNWNTEITGTTPEYFDIRMWVVEKGASFGEQDVETAANVAVLGSMVAESLFGPDEDPIGQTIRIKNLPFRVVGVTASKGQTGFGSSQDDVVHVPFTTVQKKMTGETWLHSISVQAISREATAVAEEQIAALLRQRHRMRADQEDDFMVRNMVDFADLADQAAQVMTLLLGAIASVSLIVGGIGIMNIMLVSVTERTREIGIRIAVGATESNVQSQFLIEAVVLSLIGGMIGILFGIGASSLVSRMLRWPTLTSPLAILIAVLFSIGVGIFFGYYPARKAARLDPIEALRFEV